MFNFLKKLLGGTDLTNVIEGAYIVDVRTPGEFASGHVEGAVNVPLNTLTQNLTQFKNRKQIVVCCRSGMRSGQAEKILKSKGFSNVTNGGSWQNVAKYV